MNDRTHTLSQNQVQIQNCTLFQESQLDEIPSSGLTIPEERRRELLGQVGESDDEVCFFLVKIKLNNDFSLAYIQDRRGLPEM